MKKLCFILAMILTASIVTAAIASETTTLQQIVNCPGVPGYGPGAPSWPVYPSVSPVTPVSYYPTPVTPSRPSSSIGGLGSRTLKRTYPCMRGSDVRNLQAMLNALGYYCGRADGVFGDRTKAAVRAFQRANGLKVDGIVGRATKSRLLARYRRGR